MTFARALRAILRQDPDVVMIGEIRDLETARIAVQASLTGHLVLATLHTNDAAGAVTRLIDMGVEPFLLASTLLGVLAQRLVRKLCPDCRKQGALSAQRTRGGPGAPAGPPGVHRGGLPAVQVDRIPRPHRNLRAAHRRRRDAASSSTTPRRRRLLRERAVARRHDDAPRRRLALGRARRDDGRGGAARDAAPARRVAGAGVSGYRYEALAPDGKRPARRARVGQPAPGAAAAARAGLAAGRGRADRRRRRTGVRHGFTSGAGWSAPPRSRCSPASSRRCSPPASPSSRR